MASRPKWSPLRIAVALAAVAFLCGTVRGQTPYAWNVGNGNWSAAGSWTPAGGPPGLNDNATVNIAGTYTVTLNTNQSVHDLTLNNATATLSQTGAKTLTVGGTVALAAGKYILNDGTISGGSITSAGGLLQPQVTGGTLNNVAVGVGVLDFTTFGQLKLQGTSTLAAGTTLNLNAGSRIGFQQTTALDNLTVNLAGFSPALSVDGSNTLTLGSSTTITSTTPAGGLLTSGLFVGGTGVIQNKGLVRTTGSGLLFINPTSFVNQSGGIVRGSSGGTVQIQTGGVINQAGGTFDANGGTFNLLGTNWSNQGAITLGSGTLNLGGSFTTAGIGTVNRTGGTVMITGALDNSAATLALNASTGSYQLAQNGSITGGGVTASGGSQLLLSSGNSNRLNNVDVGLGVLNFDLPNGRVRLQGSSSLAAGTTLDLNGTINVVGFEQTTTLNNLTVNLNTPLSALSVEGNNTLTLGGTTTVTGTASVSLTSGLLVSGGTGVLQNQGLIRNNSTSTLTINPTTFTNQSGGVVRVSGGTVSIPDATNLTNVAAGALTGGNWEVQANAALDFGSRTISTVNAGTTVELNGANATFNALNALTTNNGTLRVLGGSNFAPTGGAVTNTGVIEVGAGSTLTSDLTVRGGGALRGGGTLGGNGSTSSGNATFDTTGGTLSPGLGTGTGVLTVAGNLTLNGNTTVAIKLNGNAAGTGYDQVKVNGSVDLGDAVLNLAVDPAYPPAQSDLLFVVNKTSSGAISGTFFDLPDNSPVTVNGVPGTLTYFGNADTMSPSGGNDVVIFFAPVPEPACVLAVAVGGLAVAAGLRRRSRPAAGLRGLPH